MAIGDEVVHGDFGGCGGVSAFFEEAGEVTADDGVDGFFDGFG